MKNVIHIFGASGSGTTTLGKKICEELGYTLMDTDNYFWIPTEPPFTHKRPKKERIELMKSDINKSENVVISGSLTDWGDELIPYFTLAIRIEMKQSIRIERLVKREKERYGSRIEIGGDMYQQHLDFIEWAKSYDNGGMDIRSKAMHDELQKSFSCKILYLDGENKLEDNFEKPLDDQPISYGLMAGEGYYEEIVKGMAIEQVQKLFGHEKIDTTLRYAQVKQSNVKIAHKKYIG